MRRLLLPVLLAVAATCPAAAAEYVTPPILPVPDAWQGRGTGLVRVLDKLDAHVELLTLAAGQTGHYKSLAVTLRSCMDRPDGMPHDSAAFVDVQDAHGNGQPFTGWTFSNEPSIGVFESPIYGVQLVNCQGDLVAPAAPPLPAAVPAPPGLLHDAQAPAAGSDGTGTTGSAPDDAGPQTPDAAAQGGGDRSGGDGSGGAGNGGGADQGGVDQGAPDRGAGVQGAGSPDPSRPDTRAPSPSRSTPPPAAPSDAAPDAVYPDGAPPPKRF